jgi:O-methyltransferase involved in polyketide biosynthesis
MIARQRAAHQVLDHGSILYDPFAMKILREDEKDVLQFANAQIVILGAGLDTFALGNPHGARQIRIYEVDHPATQAREAERHPG